MSGKDAQRLSFVTSNEEAGGAVNVDTIQGAEVPFCICLLSSLLRCICRLACSFPLCKYSKTLALMLGPSRMMAI